MAEELALIAKFDQLYPMRSFANSRQPRPIHFYGPGPGGSVHPHDPPVGTLHFARWRHELAAIEDPDGLGYYHEENPLTINGQQIRPTYITKGNQTAREVNYFRWERVAADLMKGVKAFPGPGTTRAVHDEYLLNEDDFNTPDAEKPKVLVGLNNRQDEDPRTIYPLGYKLLKQWSKANGHAEWEEGSCLGADPHNPNALTKHIGWFPKRLRVPKAGIGADPQDIIWNEIFHGNLDAKPKEKFSKPKDTWADDPDKIMTMTSSKNSYMAQDLKCAQALHVLSLEALKATLPPPEPDTLNARMTWLDAQAAKRSACRVKQDATTRELAVEKPKVAPLSEQEMTADTQSTKKLVATKMIEEVDIKLVEELEVTEMAEHLKNLEIMDQSKAAQISKKRASKGTEITTRDTTAEEREAIEAKLKELSRNPEPGKEGKTPILIYSAFRSKFLGIPVIQIVGYEK
ncbi:hypothetical protein F4823DRAFT_612941 [Ustulina deusta]|nr:hypothetical protein F4823DRAFT_612941 [Ustulina deusta]